MARIVMADDGIAFDGRTLETGPLGGAESAFIAVAEALARRGHSVLAATSGSESVTHNGVEWRPLARGLPDEADLYIANRGDKLLTLVPRARHVAFWIHNPARYLIKLRYLWKLWRRRPTLVFLGAYHASTYPAWAPGGRRVTIPFGTDARFLTITPPSVPPRPRAVFISNPLRGLDWLIELWVTRIHPAVRNAELHIFSGPAAYGSVGDAKAAQMKVVLDFARRMSECGIVVRDPVPKSVLAEELAQFRVFTYRGTEDETFCAAASEAQAAGVPGVVCTIGSLPERVINRTTGFVVSAEEGRDEDEFAVATAKLLTDDALWGRMHAAALARQRSRSWDDAAADFESLIGSTR
jgi:glycosyltransferase involved in cell wall biosynthesis